MNWLVVLVRSDNVIYYYLMSNTYVYDCYCCRTLILLLLPQKLTVDTYELRGGT